MAISDYLEPLLESKKDDLKEGFKNTDKIKNNIGDVIFNHINTLNKEQLEEMLIGLKEDIKLELDNSGRSERYFKLKDEEFLILHRLERNSEFKESIESDSVTVDVGGYDYDIVIMDSTHLKFKPKGSENWAIPLHIRQLSDEMTTSLKDKNLIINNSFVTEK